VVIALQVASVWPPSLLLVLPLLPPEEDVLPPLDVLPLLLVLPPLDVLPLLLVLPPLDVLPPLLLLPPPLEPLPPSTPVLVPASPESVALLEQPLA
jgi:hypothetical protein